MDWHPELHYAFSNQRMATGSGTRFSEVGIVSLVDEIDDLWKSKKRTLPNHSTCFLFHVVRQVEHIAAVRNSGTVLRVIGKDYRR